MNKNVLRWGAFIIGTFVVAFAEPLQALLAGMGLMGLINLCLNSNQKVKTYE